MAMEEELLNRMEVEGQELLNGVDGREDVVRVVFEREGGGEGGRDSGEVVEEDGVADSADGGRPAGGGLYEMVGGEERRVELNAADKDGDEDHAKYFLLKQVHPI